MISLAALLKLNYKQPLGGVFALSGPQPLDFLEKNTLTDE